VVSLSKIAMTSYLNWLEDQCGKIEKSRPKKTEKKKFSPFGPLYRQLSLHLSRHMRGIPSSVLRESMLHSILGGAYPSQSTIKACQYKHDDLEVYIMGGTPYYKIKNIPNSTFEDEDTADEKLIKQTFDKINAMICVVVNDEMKEVDIGRIYLLNSVTGNVVKTNSLNDETYNYKNMNLSRRDILLKLCIAVESKKSHVSSYLQKINVGTLESSHNEDPLYNSERFDSTGGEQLVRDMSVIEFLFPQIKPRVFTHLTDLVLGNALQNIIPMCGEDGRWERDYVVNIFRGIGNCCPVLRVLDMTGSAIDSDSLLYLLLRDPVEVLHKYCYNSTEFWMKKGFHNPKGKVAPHDMNRYCQYCKDPWASKSGHRYGWELCQQKMVFIVVSDQIYRTICENDWEYQFDEETLTKMKEFMKQKEEARQKRDDTDENIELEVDSDESLLAEKDEEDMARDSDGTQEATDDSANSSDDSTDSSADDPVDDLEEAPQSMVPLKHLISASNMVKSLVDPIYELVRNPRDAPDTCPDGVKKVKNGKSYWFPPSEVSYKPVEKKDWIQDGVDLSTIFNPLTKTLEVLYVSGTSAEKYSSEAIYPFITKACPNMKKLGDSLTVLKGFRLFESMEVMSNFTTGLQEFFLHYPHMLDMSQQADNVPTMMQYLMPIPQFTKPEEIYLEAFKPYIPMTMMATNMENMEDIIGDTSKDIGFVNADGKSLRTLHNEQFPLIKAADVDEVVKMISKDCEMVGTLCPQLRKLSVYMDHPWALGIMQFRGRNMYQGLSKLSMLTQFTMTAHRWENVSGIIRVIGSKLSHIHIVVSKRNDARQGELDLLSRECPKLTNLYLGIGTSPLEIRDIETFAGFPHLKTAYIGEAFKWSSFVRLVETSPLLTDLSIDKINEHWCGKPPNVDINVAMVSQLEKSVGGSTLIRNLSFSWLDVESTVVVARLVNAFPKLKSFGKLALDAKQLSLLKGYVSMMADDGVQIAAFNKAGIQQPNQLPQAYHDAEENCTIS